jgi:integrase
MLCLILIVGGLLIMMGQHDRSEALFYYFRLEDQVPETHLLRLMKKTPMRPENWLRRQIRPIATRLTIDVPVNFQVLRRTFATNAQSYGNMKDVQAHLRHSNIATTADVYTQPVPESVRKLVNAVAQDVMTAEAPAIEEPIALTGRIQ